MPNRVEEDTLYMMRRSRGPESFGIDSSGFSFCNSLDLEIGYISGTMIMIHECVRSLNLTQGQLNNFLENAGVQHYKHVVLIIYGIIHVSSRLAK